MNSPFFGIEALLLLVVFLLIFGPASIDDDLRKPRYRSFRFYLSFRSASGPNNRICLALVVFVVALALTLLAGAVT